MKTRVSLSLEMPRTKARKSLRSVLAPDNVGIPRGTRLQIEVMGSNLVFGVASDSVSTAISTVLALVRDASLFQEVWLLSRKKGAKVQRK